MADSDTHVAPPDVRNWRATAVIAGVHAHGILLMEAGLERNNPIGAFFVGATLIGPESFAGDGIGVIGPGADVKIVGAGVGVADVKDGHISRWGSDGQCLFERGCGPSN